MKQTFLWWTYLTHLHLHQEMQWCFFHLCFWRWASCRGLQPHPYRRKQKDGSPLYDQPIIKFHDWGRRSFAHRISMKGGDLASLQKLGNWADPKIALHYTNEIPQEHLSELTNKPLPEGVFKSEGLVSNI